MLVRLRGGYAAAAAASCQAALAVGAGHCGRGGAGGSRRHAYIRAALLAQGATLAVLAPLLGQRRQHRRGEHRLPRVRRAASGAPQLRSVLRGCTPVDDEEVELSPSKHLKTASPRQWMPPKRKAAQPGAPRMPPLTQISNEVYNEVGDPDMNIGFLYVKPHADLKAVLDLVTQRLADFGIEVESTGGLQAQEMAELGTIDEHYGSLAAKALAQHPAEHVVQPDAQARFAETFGLTWQEALDQRLACNASEAMARLNLTAEELDDRWTPLKIGVDKAKMGGGFYCGAIGGLYVVNGFYMAMRKKYISPGCSVTWFCVRWPSTKLTWAEFRKDVVGDTDPTIAGERSLRGDVHRRWRELGLPAEPHVGENVVHASASPLEALYERANWTGSHLSEDPFAARLIRLGITPQTLKHWRKDPVVMYEGKKRSLFDLVENLDSRDCLAVASALRAEEELELAAAGGDLGAQGGGHIHEPWGAVGF